MQSGILSGRAIQQAVSEGLISIAPFNPKHINPVSYDLTLGSTVRLYKGGHYINSAYPFFSNEKVFASELAERTAKGSIIEPYPPPSPSPLVLDAKKDNPSISIEMSSEGFLLKPGIGYLMHTQETIWTDTYVPILDGKSSLARLFISVHDTAGYIDPGFKGQITLEVTVTHPVIVYPGMRFCQVRFHTIVGEVDLYRGHYTGDTAQGAVSSQSFQQIEELKNEKV